jgi:transcriptional regulator with XRE-family HTH domain
VIYLQEKKFLISIGSILKEIRMQKNLSQENLANDADIPINQIGRIERAEINTSLLTIFKITNALEISVSDFFEKLNDFK